MSNSLGLFKASGQTAVERAIAEFRAGRPVEIRDDRSVKLALPVSALEPEQIAVLEMLTQGRARLAMPAARLRHLGLEREVPGTVALPQIDFGRLEMLVLKVDGRIDAPVGPCDEIDLAALELGALALIPPAMILVPLARVGDAAGMLAAEACDILAYRRLAAVKLSIVSRAPVPLEGAPQTEFIVFRGGEGLRDQVAIIVGQPDRTRPVSVRLHSACLTGDLFGSLKCDCGDQLRGTVRYMAENGGGVLLYLDQEGRGNGIANKVKAYRLQHDGYDTYDADEILGFGLDQRRFDFAAEMLRHLDVTRVALITNNPDKIGALHRAGIDVVADQRALGRRTAENVSYLRSKRDKAGHSIDLDALVLRKPVHD
jgi:GTP cyclohydrolase II